MTIVEVEWPCCGTTGEVLDRDIDWDNTHAEAAGYDGRYMKQHTKCGAIYPYVDRAE